MIETIAGIDLWFEFASTYSYLAVHDVAKLDVRVRFRPFLLGPIFAAQGWKDSPFLTRPRALRSAAEPDLEATSSFAG